MTDEGDRRTNRVSEENRAIALAATIRERAAHVAKYAETRVATDEARADGSDDHAAEVARKVALDAAYIAVLTISNALAKKTSDEEDRND